MKNQYVGDIRDFEKYSVLRTLASASGLPLVVSWMLTPDDGTRDGRQLDYMEQPARYRHLDSHVFDRLGKIVRAGERSVEAVERYGVLEHAVFFDRELRGQESSRLFFFAALWETLSQSSLIFFDPDTGIAPAKASKGRATAAKYIFEDEVADGYHRGHSLIIFDHFKRVRWPDYLADALPRLTFMTGAPSAIALHSAGVAFLVIPQPDRAAVELAEYWNPELKYTVFHRR